MHSSQATSPGGGWVTTSDLSVTVTEHDRQKTVSCYAINAELGETIVESKVVSVICKRRIPHLPRICWAVLELVFP